MPQNVALLYGHVATNLGDLAINEGVRALCEKHKPGFSLDVYMRRANPSLVDGSFEHLAPKRIFSLEGYQRSYSNSDELKSTLELLAALTDPKSWVKRTGFELPNLMIGNGGEHFYEHPAGENLTDLLWRIVPLVVAAAAGCRVIQMPSTFGPFYTPSIRSVLNAVETITPGVVAREAISAALLQDEGLNPEIVLDPAFMLPLLKQTNTRDKRIAIVPRLERYGMRAGASSSSYQMTRARQSGFRESAGFGWAVSVANSFLAEEWIIDLYIQTAADRELVHSVSKALRRAGHGGRVHVHEPISVMEYRKLLARSSGLVSARFHANILALSMGIPAIGVYHRSHGRKMPGLYEMFDIPQAAIELDGSASRVIAARAVKQFKLLSERMLRLNQRVNAMRDKTDEWFARVTAQPVAQSSYSAIRLDLLSLVQKQLIEQTRDMERASKSYEKDLASVLQAIQQLRHERP